MKLPFKPHLLVLLCSAGLFAASGTMFVKSRTTEPAPAAPAAQQPTAPPAQSAPVVAPAYTAAQIDQWVAPVALYPDALLSQIFMASTYPSNVIQAAQWSKDNPKMQGDAAIQAVAGQPWDPSVKSLVAFPQLMSLMGENPPWVQNLGDAFLAQPKDVMDSVQRLRALAQKTGALQSTPQQTVTTVTKPAPAKTTASTTTAETTTSPTVIKIESTDPQVVYVPTYNPNTVYGTWPNAAYPPVYLPPSPGEQFTDSLVKGLGFSLGVATTYAIFSNIDWDDDDDWDHHHHDDDWDHHGGYNRNGDNNININVDNFNKIGGLRLNGDNRTWQHNPAYREGVPYPTNQLASRFHSTNAATGLSATQRTPASRDSQRQAALSQMEKSTGKTFTPSAHTGTRDARRLASAQQLKQISQRNSYRGYDTRPQTVKRTATPVRENHQAVGKRVAQSAQQPARVHRANALSGNDSRSGSWQAQQQRGAQSRQLSAHQQLPRQRSVERAEHREFHHR
ncbi:DUF3300 domain-containing protein [Enterobacter cloacae complex sp. 2022EL-00788]|uniref:DUF3300 domain-containing protein n=1 Tax=Enterobacter cloacae complex sp. 2022EL-00788 TaxID=2996512 RepID=UPI0020750EF2|nr:DUF3300 domain-containing protein [Enterobacter cloacae complex sp. 2022EL-00788]MCM7514140.1 DUF3300 domain-containing protein [Enterobacter hormaechei]MCY0773514.1 DUF3300 domain-containing protein [Enterobacter cloacae complex sp. 2022EL-00788]